MKTSNTSTVHCAEVGCTKFISIDGNNWRCPTHLRMYYFKYFSKSIKSRNYKTKFDLLTGFQVDYS